MICSECEKLKNKKNVIYEDQLVIAVLNEKPSTGGHIILLPKEHFTILEQVPDAVISHMFSVANKLSVSLFDALGAHGTNILIQNGIAAGQKTNHFSLHVIPRVESDGMGFHWNTIKMSDEDLNMVQTMIKEDLDKKEEAKKEVKEEIKEPEEEIPEEENYMLKQLERIP